jgi:hypothetical protein
VTIAAWPGTVPYLPLRDQLRRSNARTVKSTEMEDGPPVMRLQSQTRIKRMQYAIKMLDAERNYFETFVETTLNGGVDHFTMSVPLIQSDTFVTRRCYIENGDWSESYTGTHWVVSFTLCVFTAALS